jgi:hypothetical protein
LTSQNKEIQRIKNYLNLKDAAIEHLIKERDSYFDKCHHRLYAIESIKIEIEQNLSIFNVSKSKTKILEIIDKAIKL